jgi:cell division protein FtsQ
MSEGFVFERTASEDAPVRSKIDRRLKWLLIALAVLLAGELVWVLGVTPCMPFSVIEISGIPNLDRVEALARAGIGPHSSYITLEGRKAVAMSLAPVNGKLEPVLFDKYGVVFQIGNDGFDSGVAMETLPLISGLVFAEVSLGMKLPVIFRGFLADLAKLSSTAPELLGTISEIQASRKVYDGLELALFPIHYPAKVLVGNEITADTIRYMLLLIDVFKKQGVVTDEIDFRTGTASYRKEASLGQ